jgi:predicted flap endonuclease-1-like 5' DNA nuclease
MRKAENINAPNLWGWAIGAAAGLVAFGVLVIVGEFNLFPAAFLGACVAALAGLVLGMPWGAGSPAGGAMPAARAAAHAASAPAEAAPAKAEPARPAAAAPAALMATPAAAPAAKAATAGPERLKTARGGKADDLKEIEGIGPAMERLLNELGFHHFDQIASWSEADVALVDAEMKTFKGRITRDKWVSQARIIVAEGLEAFRERAKTNEY